MERAKIKVEEVPCKKLGYCPYGKLVEKFPVDEVGGGEKSCPVMGIIARHFILPRLLLFSHP